ncbi:MAG: trigger factor [Deltaproteobacteria bacterium]|nr:trigger factor [Deltaproteobacteria bacterium]
MNIQVDSINEVKKKLTITVEDGHVQEHIDEAYKSLQKNANIPGFRKGKTPRSLLEKKFGPRVEADVFQDLMRESMTKALAEKNLDAIHIFDVSKPAHTKGKGLTYEASVEIRPHIELKKYKGLTVKKNAQDVKEESIQDVLTRIQDSHAVMKPVEAKTPKKGQYASVIFEQLDQDGHPVEAKTPGEQLHMLGHPSAIKEIDDAIAKLNIDASTVVQTKETTGKDKRPALHVRITLKSIKEKEVPTIDDKFAKTVGPFKSLDELKDKIKEDLAAELEEQKKVDYATQILDQLRKDHPAPYPDTLKQQEMQNLRQEFFNRVVQSGQSLPEDFSVEKMEADMKPEAERRVHEQIILSAVAKAEDINVDAKELEHKIHELAHIYNKPVQELFAELEKNNRLDALRSQILSQKTLDFLLNEATIK